MEEWQWKSGRVTEWQWKSGSDRVAVLQCGLQSGGVEKWQSGRVVEAEVALI